MADEEREPKGDGQDDEEVSSGEEERNDGNGGKDTIGERNAGGGGGNGSVAGHLKDSEGESARLDYDKKTSRGELAVKVICLGDSAVGKSK